MIKVLELPSLKIKIVMLYKLKLPDGYFLFKHYGNYSLNIMATFGQIFFSSKHTNLGSSVEDLVETDLMVKTGLLIRFFN